MATNIYQTMKVIREMGLTCGRTYHGEFRVNIKGGSEATAYYTKDAEDAVGTAKWMLKESKVA